MAAANIKTFSIAEATEPVEFQIGKDVFTARPPESLPANVLIKYSEMVGEGKLYDAHHYFFQKSLLGESIELFTTRLEDSDNPINLGTMVQVAEWLVEMYSAFPTTPAKA